MWFLFAKNLRERIRSGKSEKSLREPFKDVPPIAADDERIALRKPTPRKDTYSCFVWQLYEFDLPALRDRVLEHKRLSLSAYTDFIDQEDEALVAAAKSSDILLLTSGGGVFDVDGFLKLVGISEKMVVLVSTMPIESARSYIKSRMDFHIPKDFIYRASEFRPYMKKILKELDGA